MSQASDIFCGKCGDPIEGELPNLEASQRTQCPRCGSTERKYGVVSYASLGAESVATVRATATLPISIIDYPTKFLDVSQDLIEQGQFEMAVVAAHMACEVATEQALSKAFDALNKPTLKDAVYDFMNGYNLANERIRKIYTALTGDRVVDQPFWSNFKASAERRNRIVHSGLTVDKADAENSLTATRALVAHLPR